MAEKSIQLSRSAPTLTGGLVALAVGGTTIAASGDTGVTTIGFVVSIAGFVWLLLGVHRLASNVDAIMLSVLEREAEVSADGTAT